MRPIKKIQAFTLGEIVIVLILTGIVVGLAFSVLSLVQKQIAGMQENYNKNTELNKLETALWLDFNKYADIHFDALENELIFSTTIDSITYKFSTAYITKNIDTFEVQLKDKKMFFAGNAVSDGPIDALRLETTKAFQHQPLFIFKPNDANTFMK